MIQAFEGIDILYELYFVWMAIRVLCEEHRPVFTISSGHRIAHVKTVSATRGSREGIPSFRSNPDDTPQLARRYEQGAPVLQ